MGRDSIANILKNIAKEKYIYYLEIFRKSFRRCCVVNV